MALPAHHTQWISSSSGNHHRRKFLFESLKLYPDSTSHIYLANTNGVAGFLIEKGKLSKPVRGIIIGGNLLGLLPVVDKVASNLTWFQSTGCPTLLVSNIKIGGSKQ